MIKVVSYQNILRLCNSLFQFFSVRGAAGELIMIWRNCNAQNSTVYIIGGPRLEESFLKWIFCLFHSRCLSPICRFLLLVQVFALKRKIQDFLSDFTEKKLSNRNNNIIMNNNNHYIINNLTPIPTEYCSSQNGFFCGGPRLYEIQSITCFIVGIPSDIGIFLMAKQNSMSSKFFPHIYNPNLGV